MAVALSPWWLLRGRSLAGYTLLRAAAERATGDEDARRAAQLWLGRLAERTSDLPAALGHYTAVSDALAAAGPSPELVEGLVGRLGVLRNLGRVPEAVENARRAVALAGELRYPAAEALALIELCTVTQYGGDFETSLELAQQACRIDPAGIPGWIARWCVSCLTIALSETGQVAAAERTCTDAVARAREAGALEDLAHDLVVMLELEWMAGRLADAVGNLHEALGIASSIGDWLHMASCLDACGHWCAATGRWAEAITLWAALAANSGLPDRPSEEHRRQEPLRQAGQALGSAQTRQPGTRPGDDLATVEFAAMLTAPNGQPRAARSDPAQRPGTELVTLVPRAAPTPRSLPIVISVEHRPLHLDRIATRAAAASRRPDRLAAGGPRLAGVP
jgi:tetratricopeptide (TPR) repeat protein